VKLKSSFIAFVCTSEEIQYLQYF